MPAATQQPPSAIQFRNWLMREVYDAATPEARAYHHLLMCLLPKEQWLTFRQSQVLGMLLKGLSQKEMTYRLNLSSKTINTFKTELFERLHITNLIDLARWAIRNNLLDV